MRCEHSKSLIQMAATTTALSAHKPTPVRPNSVGPVVVLLSLLLCWLLLMQLIVIKFDFNYPDSWNENEEKQEQEELLSETNDKNEQIIKLFHSKFKFKQEQLDQANYYSSSNELQTRGHYLLEPKGDKGGQNVINCDNYNDELKASNKEDNNSKRSKLYIIVNSHWKNQARRKWMRSSWLNAATIKREVCQDGSSASLLISQVEFVFVLGSSGGELNLNSQLAEEDSNHGDLLLLAQVQEDYKNLTLKHLASLKWFMEAESSPVAVENGQFERKILLKCDDDAELDLTQWMDELKNVANNNNNNKTTMEQKQEESASLFCARFNEHSQVKRQTNNKWFLTRNEWNFDTFPAYCSGLAYMIGPNAEPLVGRLLAAAELMFAAEGNSNEPRTGPLWIDDVFITGVLPASFDEAVAKFVKIIKLNNRFCYSAKQAQKRKRLGLACMASERLASSSSNNDT